MTISLSVGKRISQMLQHYLQAEELTYQWYAKSGINEYKRKSILIFTVLRLVKKLEARNSLSFSTFQNCSSFN
jgi:hypothetical protein